MQLLSTLFLTLLIFLYGGDSIAATTQASSAPRSGLCASPVNSSSISRTTRSGYDVEGRMTSSTDAAGTTTYTLYDALGRATATLLPDATMPATVLTEVAAIAAAPELADNPRTLTTYDADGRVTATTDPLGNTTTFTYDAAARRTSRSVEGSTGVSPVSLTLETTTSTPPVAKPPAPTPKAPSPPSPTTPPVARPQGVWASRPQVQKLSPPPKPTTS